MRPPRLLPVLLVGALALSGCASAFRTAAAVVNGTVIEDEGFQKGLRFFAADPGFSEGVPPEEVEGRRQTLSRQLLTFLIHQELVEAFAQGVGLTATEAEISERLDAQIEQQGGKDVFGAQVKKAGITFIDVRELIRKQVIREKVAQKIIDQEVTDGELQSAYEERVLEFTEIHVSHILVDTKKQAQEILEEATPENFADLAKRHSSDTGSAQQGGDLGLQPAGQFVEAFARAALEIPVGEIGGPVETEFGFHVLYVLERNTPPLEEVRDRLLQDLGGQAFQDWLLGRLKTSEVRVNPRYGTFDPTAGEVVERNASSPEPEPQLTP